MKLTKRKLIKRIKELELRVQHLEERWHQPGLVDPREWHVVDEATIAPDPLMSLVDESGKFRNLPKSVRELLHAGVYSLYELDANADAPYVLLTKHENYFINENGDVISSKVDIRDLKLKSLVIFQPSAPGAKSFEIVVKDSLPFWTPIVEPTTISDRAVEAGREMGYTQGDD